MIHDDSIVTELADILQPPGERAGPLRVEGMSASFAGDGDPAWLTLVSYKGHRYIAKVWRAKSSYDERPPAPRRTKKPRKKAAAKKRGRR